MITRRRALVASGAFVGGLAIGRSVTLPLTQTGAAQPAPVTQDPYARWARIYNVVDGDTMDAEVDLGYNTRTDRRLRLLDIDTPEVNSRVADERRRANEATEAVTRWLIDHAPHNRVVTLSWGGERVQPFSVASTKADSFGRYLARVSCQEGHLLNQWLLDAGYAMPYSGD